MDSAMGVAKVVGVKNMRRLIIPGIIVARKYTPFTPFPSPLTHHSRSRSLLRPDINPLLPSPSSSNQALLSAQPAGLHTHQRLTYLQRSTSRAQIPRRPAPHWPPAQRRTTRRPARRKMQSQGRIRGCEEVLRQPRPRERGYQKSGREGRSRRTRTTSPRRIGLGAFVGYILSACDRQMVVWSDTGHVFPWRMARTIATLYFGFYSAFVRLMEMRIMHSIP